MPVVYVHAIRGRSKDQNRSKSEPAVVVKKSALPDRLVCLQCGQ